MTLTEPTRISGDACYVRRQSISACLLVLAVSTGLYGRYDPSVVGLSAAIVGVVAAAASLGFYVAAMVTLLRSPQGWPLYRLRDRLLSLPQLPRPFALASVVGVVGAFVHLALILLK